MEATTSTRAARGRRDGQHVVPAHDTNRLTEFRDFNADLGGSSRRTGSGGTAPYRRTNTGQRYPDADRRHPEHVGACGTAKTTFNLAANHKFTGFYQYADKEQPDYLGAIRIAGGRADAGDHARGHRLEFAIPDRCLEG